MKKKMNKIKPCPFCGTEVELSKKPLWHGGHGYYNCFEFEIVCPTCGCNVRYDKNDTIYRAEEEAIQNVIKAWNRREKKMANAKKCDVCGKLYELPMCNDVVRIHLDFGYLGDRYVDLCDDCYTKLCDFIKPTLPKDNSFKRRKS